MVLVSNRSQTVALSPRQLRAMEGVDQEEPIFDLATKCEGLYASRISTLNNSDDQNAAKIVSDLYQRFGAWAAFLGVFAESNVCLDRRLQRRVEIQDQVLRLLDIMLSNLTYLFEANDQSGSNSTEHVTSTNTLQKGTRVNTHCLDAISGALDRLNQLGTAIRRSSVTSQITKARIFAETFDFSSFDQVAIICLRALYPDMSDSLVDHLAKSMTETYALFLHRKSRKARLELPRASPRALLVLNAIPEEFSESVDADLMDIDLEVPVDSVELSDNNRLTPPSNQVHRPTQSAPTSVDTKELKTRLRKLLGPPSTSKPLSILANQVDYPRPAKESLICEWCFSPLTADTLEKHNWQKHINEDFKPYICLSEKCSHGTPRFASSHEWLQHMSSTHGESWHREIHASSSWACPLCSEDTTFSTSGGLAEHLAGCHEGIFKPHQVNAIVRQSIFPVTRPNSTCPLCCFPMGDDQLHNSRRKILEDNLPVTSEVKRLKTEAGYAHINRSDFDAEPPPVDVKNAAGHVASHLQNVMLLTLRLISIQGVPDNSREYQSDSSDTDYQASWTTSGQRDLHGDRLDIGSEDHSSAHADYSLDIDELLTLEHVPDSVPLDWTDILPSIVPDISADDLATIDPPEAGKQTLPSRGNDDEIRYHLSARQEIIKKLLHSEFAFGIDMAVLARFYKGMTSSCPELSPEDITIIFRNSSQLHNFSVLFLEQLEDAAKSVYVRPASQRWPRRSAADSQPQTTNEAASTRSSASYVDRDQSTSVGTAFLTNGARLKEVYSEYLHSRAAADKRLRTVEKRSKVAKWVKQCDEYASQSAYRAGFHSLLGKPINHLLDYCQMLDDLLTVTPTDHPDQKALLQAVAEVKSLLQAVGTIREEHAVSRSESSSRPGFGKPLRWRRRKSSVADLDPDVEFTLLARRFSANIPQIRTIMQQVHDDLAINPFAQIIDAMERLDVTSNALPSSPVTFSVNDMGKREILISRVHGLILSVFPSHRKTLERHVVTPLATLLELYEGPRKAIESRAKLLPQHTEFTILKQQGKRTGKRITEQALEFMALNESLKAELPKLQSLTARLLQLCLGRLAHIQASLLLEMQKSLESYVGSIPDNWQIIVGDWESRDRLAEAHLGSLIICNRSFMNELIARRPLPAPLDPSNLKTEPTPVMFVRALYDYDADDDMTLSFREGDIIQVLHVIDTGWWDGVLNNVRGWFPSNYCRVIPPYGTQSQDNPYLGEDDDTHESFQLPSYARTDPPGEDEKDSWIPQATPDGRLYYFPLAKFPLMVGNSPIPGATITATRTGRADTLPVIRRALPSIEEEASLRTPQVTLDGHVPALPSPSTKSGSVSMDAVETPTNPGLGSDMKVLWRAASLFEFNLEGLAVDQGYPYLIYTAGEIFNVVSEQDENWLAWNQDDPTRGLGWIWSRHFEKLA
ncbi:hypothetical protein BDW74DRAFT_180205 [Aspergillus multicolor]|uniref:uncharacterized protein n=1 Tax=Aspergillus multicolor TaxID=41759 RepID=UPI003CCD6753